MVKINDQVTLESSGIKNLKPLSASEFAVSYVNGTVVKIKVKDASMTEVFEKLGIRRKP